MPAGPNVIIAIDPGGTTGYVHYKRNRFVEPCTGVLAEAGELPPMEFLDRLDGWLSTYSLQCRDTELVIERFRISERTLKVSREGVHDTLDVIGGVRWLAHHYDATVVTQTPGEVKPLVTDPRLRGLGYFRGSPGGHMNDAMRHLVYRLARLKDLELTA